MTLDLIRHVHRDGLNRMVEYECTECGGHFIGDTEQTSFPGCPYCTAEPSEVEVA